jgi:hypothetical protein
MAAPEGGDTIPEGGKVEGLFWEGRYCGPIGRAQSVPAACGPSARAAGLKIKLKSSLAASVVLSYIMREYI